jgi:hypothetical protein
VTFSPMVNVTDLDDTVYLAPNEDVMPKAGRPRACSRRNKMPRRCMVRFVTEIDFDEGDKPSDTAAQNYQQPISSAVQHAVETISLRSIQNTRSRTSSSKNSRTKL